MDFQNKTQPSSVNNDVDDKRKEKGDLKMTMDTIEMTKMACLSEQRKNSLETIFEYAMEKQTDELDFYIEILEQGYTEAHVHKYIGKEAAIHMREFCEEHGLL